MHLVFESPFFAANHSQKHCEQNHFYLLCIVWKMFLHLIPRHQQLKFSVHSINTSSTKKAKFCSFCYIWLRITRYNRLQRMRDDRVLSRNSQTHNGKLSHTDKHLKFQRNSKRSKFESLSNLKQLGKLYKSINYKDNCSVSNQ